MTFYKEHRYIIAKPQKNSNFSFMGVEQISTSKSGFKDLSKGGLISKGKFNLVPFSKKKGTKSFSSCFNVDLNR